MGGDLYGGQDPGAVGQPEDLEVPCRSCLDGDHARCPFTAGQRDLVGDGFLARCCCDLRERSS